MKSEKLMTILELFLKGNLDKTFIRFSKLYPKIKNEFSYRTFLRGMEFLKTIGHIDYIKVSSGKGKGINYLITYTDVDSISLLHFNIYCSINHKNAKQTLPRRIQH